MAGQGRGSSVDLKLDLLKEGHAFSFYQVMRLLRLFTGRSARAQDPPSAETDYVRIRPKLSLAFPPADVDRVEESHVDAGPRFSVTATLLGLYGTSSPLPTFYTEDLMDEAARDESVTREFIDIFNHRLFSLLFRGWTKYRKFLRVVEERKPEDLQRLFALIGLGERTLRRGMPDAYGLIRYIGLLSQFPRSAVGLQTILRDGLGNAPVQVDSCIHTKVKIPEDQRLKMGASGCTLGVDSFVGEEIDDRMGKFRLRIGPLKRKAFQDLLPGEKHYDKLTFLTNFYVTDPLEYDVELTLAEREAQGVCLGQPEWSRLGWDTWVFTGEEIGEVSATFYPE